MDERRPVVATIGAFDGIHRGHHLLLGQVVDRARSLGLKSVCVTFDPHPDLVLYPDRHVTYLTDRAEKERVLRELGLDDVMVIEFTPALSMLNPEEFEKAWAEGRTMPLERAVEYALEYALEADETSPT